MVHGVRVRRRENHYDFCVSVRADFTCHSAYGTCSRNDSLKRLGKDAYEGVRARAVRAYALGRREVWWYTACVFGVAKTIEATSLANLIVCHGLHVAWRVRCVFPRKASVRGLRKGAYKGMCTRAVRAYARIRREGWWCIALTCVFCVVNPVYTKDMGKRKSFSAITFVIMTRASNSIKNSRLLVF